MSTTKLLAAVAGAALAWRWADSRKKRRTSEMARAAAEPKHVNTWESEGGALPQSGPQTGPVVRTKAYQG